MALGVSAGAVTTLGIWPKCLLAFIIPSMLFPVPRYLASWDTQSAVSLYTTAALLFYFIKNGLKSSEMTRRSIKDRIESRKKDQELDAIKQKRLDIMEQMVVTSSSTQSYVDTEERFLVVNETFLKIHGKSRDQVIGKKMQDMLNSETYEKKVKHAFVQCMSGEQVKMEGWVKFRKDQVDYVSSTMDPHFNTEGKVIGAVMTTVDITDRKLAEDKLKKSWELFIAAFGATPIGVSIHRHADSSFLFVNSAWESLTAYQNEDVVETGVSVKQFWFRDEDRKRYNQLLREKHKVEDFETDIVHKDNSNIPVSISVAEFSLGDEKFYINWVRDRRQAIRLEEERQVLESKLSQSRKMEAIGHLTGGIAHDFNNILQAILGYCQLARLSPQAQKDSELDSYLDYIEHGGERAQDMIRQLMIFSRSSPQKSSMQSLDTLVNNVLRLLKPSISSEIEIRAQLPQGLPEVMIDPVQFEQIVMNLCLNARDAIEGNSLINVSLENVEISSAVCNSCHEFIYGRYVELAVADTGQGIDAVHINSIFDPFTPPRKWAAEQAWVYLQFMGRCIILAAISGCFPHRAKEQLSSCCFRSIPGKNTSISLSKSLKNRQ